MHLQIPPKYKIYLVGLPSEFYEIPGQNDRSALNRLFFFCFVLFSGAFHVLFMKRATFHTKSATFPSNKQNQVNVCIHAPCTHTCTTCNTKYYQNLIYLVGLPSVLYETPGQIDRSVFNQLFLLLFRCFSWKVSLFIKKATLLMKTNKTRSVCVYICTIYI